MILRIGSNVKRLWDYQILSTTFFSFYKIHMNQDGLWWFFKEVWRKKLNQTSTERSLRDSYFAHFFWGLDKMWKINSEIKPPLCLRWVVPAPWPLLGYPEWEGRNFRTKIMATATKANPQPIATRIPKIGVTLTWSPWGLEVKKNFFDEIITTKN